MIGTKLAFVAGFRNHWLPWNRGTAQRPSSPSRPRLLVDISVILRHDAQTGIQRVVRAVWTNLLANSGQTYDAVPVFATKTQGYREAPAGFLSRRPGERFVAKPVQIEPGDKFLGLDLSAHLLPSHERQIASWRARGATTHIVVYDLLPLQRPQWFNERTVRNFRRWVSTVRNHCDQALCISDAVADELREQLDTLGTKPTIGRLRLAGDIEGSLPSRGIDGPVAEVIHQVRRMQSVLMVGTIEPRKGYDVALAAFEHIWRTNDHAPALVIVGKPGWRTEKLQELISSHPELGRRLFWLSNVSDEGLGELYNACSAIFLASHAEGFGLPAIEAAMHGKHALVRDLQVFREQNLPNLMYFSDDYPAALGEKLIELVGRSNHPPTTVLLPTWQDCVADVLVQLSLGEALQAASTNNAAA